MTTRRTSLLRAAGIPIALALALTLTGCTGDDEPTDAGTGGTSTEASPDASESAPPQQPEGVLIERAAYTVRIPEGWSDVTDNATVKDENTLRSRNDDIGIRYPSAKIAVFPDSPWDDIEETADLIMKQAHDLDPRIKRVADTTFAGEKAIHTVGPGSEDGYWYHGFTFLHDGDVVEIEIESPRGKAGAQKIVDLIRSSWEWK